MSFAKIFETKNGQVVVMRDTNDDDAPAIKFYAQPMGMGVCCTTLSFSGTDAGEAKRDLVFNQIELELVELSTKALFEFMH